MIITKEHIDKIKHGLTFGLVKGKGEPVEGKMCVEALICYSLGLPHSDIPPCVGSEVRTCKIVLNDCDWSSEQARAKGMSKIIFAQLGSDKLDQRDFALRLKLNSTKRILPYLIQKHFEKTKDAKLLEYKIKFENLEKLDNSLWKEFYNYNYNYNYYYYYYYGDKFLLLIADVILQTLKEIGSEGCKWLEEGV